MASASGHRFVSPLRISSTVRPTRNGISTPVPMATAASANETITPRRYGRRKVRSRQKVPTHHLLYFVKYGVPAIVEDRGEVAADEDAVGERPERPQRQCVADRVAHESAAARSRLEIVRVVPHAVGPRELHVDEAP